MIQRTASAVALVLSVAGSGCGGGSVGHGAVPPSDTDAGSGGSPASATPAAADAEGDGPSQERGSSASSSSSRARARATQAGTGHPDSGAAPVDSGAAPTASTSSPCSGLATQPQGDKTWSISTSSGTRSALVHVPASYDPTQRTPLVLNFHGYSGSPSQEESLTLMDAESDAKGFLLVYPQGTGELASWNAGACCGTAAEDGVDDVGFTRALLDALEAELCVDASRVFATGMSNGGFFSHRLGCELSDRIAAIAPVAGVMGIPTCTPARAVSVMEFHGTSDPLVPYDGDPAIGYTSVADTVAGWVKRDGCQAAPATTYSKGDATCVTYGQCTANAEVTLCTIQGGGHTWPGGTPFPLLGATSTDISATDAMWTFFEAHPMPSGP